MCFSEKVSIKLVMVVIWDWDWFQWLMASKNSKFSDDKVGVDGLEMETTKAKDYGENDYGQPFLQYSGARKAAAIVHMNTVPLQQFSYPMLGFSSPSTSLDLCLLICVCTELKIPM